MKLSRHDLMALAAMTVVFAAAYFASFWLRFEGDIQADAGNAFASTVLLVVATKLSFFAWYRVHRGWGRLVSFHDLVQISKAATISMAVIVMFKVLLSLEAGVPRSVFILDCVLGVAAIGGIRSFTRFLAERDPLPLIDHGKTPVFIIGTNNSGEALLRAIRRGKDLPYRVVGFITHDKRDVGSHIDAIPVVGTLDQTCELAERFGVPQVLITSGELPGQEVRQLVEQARNCNIEVRVLPAFAHIISGHVSLQPRTVSIEDLLQRDPIELHTDKLNQWLDGQTVLVTGSAGSIGSEICRQLLRFQPKKLVLVDRSENGQFFLERELLEGVDQGTLEVCLGDVTDAGRMETLFNQHQPDIVFHAAAYKHVPLVESNIGEAVKNIPLATQTLADLADQCGVKSFVMISTDKAVNPTSMMGTCKRVAELYVQALAEQSQCRFVTVRFGNVLDSAGSVVPIFRQQIARGGPVTVTHRDMTRFFMTIPEASQLVIQAGAMGKGGEIFVLDMGEPVRIADLAEDLIRLSGFKVNEDIDIEYVGLRPGEKMYEELYNDGELHTATPHPKITVADCHHIRLGEVREQLEILAASANGDTAQLLSTLKLLVPQAVWEVPLSTDRQLAKAA